MRKLNRISIGLAVRAARDAAKMSGADLARLADIVPSTLNRTENGLRALEFDEAARIADVLGISPNTLLDFAAAIEATGVAARAEQVRDLRRDLYGLQRDAIETAIANNRG